MWNCPVFIKESQSFQLRRCLETVYIAKCLLDTSASPTYICCSALGGRKYGKVKTF